MRCALSAFVLLVLSGVARAEDPAAAFQGFCDEWMQKLAVREQQNISHIQWQEKPEGVLGTYVGYTHDHTCTLKSTAAAPIGKITYLEIRYQKRGSSIAEAQTSAAHAIETTEITEIFRYDKGKWVY